MRYYILGVTVAFVLGYIVKEETTFYAVNCDITKYSYHWEDKSLLIAGVECPNSNVRVFEEKRRYYKYELIRNKLGI